MSKFSALLGSTNAVSSDTVPSSALLNSAKTPGLARRPHQGSMAASSRLNAADEYQQAWPASLRSLNDGLLDSANAPRNLQV